MNAIALFLMLVLNGNMTCGAEPPDQVMFGGQAVQVQVYDCYWSERDLSGVPQLHRSTYAAQRDSRE